VRALTSPSYAAGFLSGQGDEIKSMQQWLGDRSLPVPRCQIHRMKMKMNGIEHDMLMPRDADGRGNGRVG